MENPNRFYTYAYLREDKTPYYIGKGKGNRAYDKGRRVFSPPKDKSRILILKQNLTEEEAFRHEIYMIAVFGRKDLGTGILRNKTDGGEGSSGAIRSEETRDKLSKAHSGKTFSQETRDKISKAKSGKTHSQEHRDKISKAHTGKTHSQETKDKMSKVNIGKTLSQEHRDKISKAQSGENNPNFGKTFSQEHRNKLSKAKSGENNPKSIYWRITFADGRITTKCGLTNWAKENSYTLSSIYNVFQRKSKHHKDIVSVEKLAH